MKENLFSRLEPLLKGVTGFVGLQGADVTSPQIGGKIGMYLDAAQNPELMQAISAGLDLLLKLVIVGTTVYGLLRRKKVMVKEVKPGDTPTADSTATPPLVAN